MKMRVGVAAITALGVVLAGTNSAQALLCVVHNKTDNTGVAMKWATMPIPYFVNDEKLPEGERAAALAAVQAAFTTYQDLTCSAITFENKGKTTDTGYLNGAILVEWGDDVSMGGSAYMHSTTGTVASEGKDIERSAIQLNAKYYGVGKISNKFDIQTTLKYLIGASLGFYAGGGDPHVGNFTEIQFDVLDLALTAEQMDGARYIYYEDDGTGCTEVAVPVACHTIAPISPEGGKKDTGSEVIVDGGTNPTKDSSVSMFDKGTSSTGDGAIAPTPEDDGCCRVSHSPSGSSPFLAVIGVLILVALFRRRRRG